MPGQPKSSPICPGCGGQVPPDAPRGYCLQCLFALGTGGEGDGGQGSEVRGQGAGGRERRSEVRETKNDNRTDSDSLRTSPPPDSRPLAPDLCPPPSASGLPPSALCPLPPALGPLAFGDYELIEEIARGGMGVVYKARQRSLGRIVAVKRLLFGDQAGKELAQRFRAEAALAASLQHPNIVAIHEVGAHEGQPFFAMDFVEGQSLARVNAECEVRNAGWLRRAARYVRIVAGAIDHAHERGILHRDLKPSNVLIDAFDQPRVTDFGLAKRLDHDSDLTLSGQVLGSPNYMPPEQAAAKHGQVGRRSDVYSLGAILYHLLTGLPPFVGETLTETLQEVVNREPVGPRLLNPSVPRDLETLCLKCLEKEPARRYPTAQALAEDLDRFLRDEPIRARPIGATAKVWRWCRRKPVVATLGLATLVLLLAVAVGSPIAISRIAHQRERAEKGELDARQKAYASDMSLAQQALGQNNLGRAQELLNRHRPTFGVPASAGSLPSRDAADRLKAGLQTDLRGWEWRYLWQDCQSEALFTLCQKSNAIFCLALSADGKSLAIGESAEGQLSIWDLPKREEITRFPPGQGPVFAAFSPREHLLAFSSGIARQSEPHRVRLWDGDTQRIVADLPLESTCRGLAFSGDGHTLATISARKLSTGRDGELALWNVREGTKRVQYPVSRVRPNQGRPFAIAHDLSMAAYAVWTDGLRAMDLRSGEERWTAKVPDEMVTALAISPDGKTLAVAGGYAPAPLRLWDLASGTMIGESSASESQRGYVCSLAFSPDGKTLASGGSDQAICLWDAEGLRLKRRFQGHKSEVWSLVVLPDNSTLVSGGKDGSVLVWNMEASQRADSHVRLPENLLAWCFATNGQTVFTCDRQGRVSQWQENYRVEERLFEMGTNLVQANIIPHRSLVFARSALGNIQVWDLQKRSFLRELLVSGGPPAKCFIMSRGNKLILGSLPRQTIHEIDVTTWENVRTWEGPVQVWSGAISPDEQWCVTLGGTGTSVIHDLTTGRTRAGTIGLKGVVGAMFSGDGKLLAAASDLGFARIWDAATMEEIATLRGFLQSVSSVAFSPQNDRLVTGSDGKEAIKLWDVESHEELLTLEGQGSTFSETAFSADGAVLGSMNAGDTKRSILHLWRAPSWAEIEAAEKKSRRDGRK